uniref:Uncharacterized protein n=1 Tax=Arundo donax TaxID=35708 RepID=A0A0A8YN10_ARUDO
MQIRDLARYIPTDKEKSKVSLDHELLGSQDHSAGLNLAMQIKGLA